MKMRIKELGNDCIGCLSCSYSCPVNAIDVICNELNEPYVKIDRKKCVRCLKCDSMCPVINSQSIKTNRIVDAYCAYSSDEIVKSSSSGGFFFSLAKELLKANWFICGAVYSEDYRSVKHIITNKLSDVTKMRGSKYIESSLKSFYPMLNDVLRGTTERVLFSGTPCQCAAIKSHYKKYSDRLYFVEVICNGVMPPVILDNEIQRIEQLNKSKISFYTMRYKTESYFPLYSKFSLIDGKETITPFYETNIGILYGSRIILRECCYSCNFKGMKRSGNITIGDYHGFLCDGGVPKTNYGASTVIVNDSKGEFLLSLVKEKQIVSVHKAIEITEAIKNNNRLVINGYAPNSTCRKRFKKQLVEKGISEASNYSKRFYKRKNVIIRKITEKVQLMFCKKS